MALPDFFLVVDQVEEAFRTHPRRDEVLRLVELYIKNQMRQGFWTGVRIGDQIVQKVAEASQIEMLALRCRTLLRLRKNWFVLQSWP